MKQGSPVSGSPVSADSASISDSCSISEYPISDITCSLDDDLWMIILKCHQSPDPPGALINASRLTLRPFLTVLATCYEVFHINDFQNLCCPNTINNAF